MHKTVLALTLAVLVTACSMHAAPQTTSTGSASASAACDPAIGGFYEGTATSKQAGVLSVSLNLTCEAGDYRGEFATPVGKFQVLSGSLRGTTFIMAFGAGQDRGTLEVETKTAPKFSGHFNFGDDSGPVELARTGEAKRAGYDKPTLQLTPAQWREDLHYFATEVPKVHANAFYHMSRPAFDAAVAAAGSKLAHADGDQAYVAIDSIANAIGDGHTFIIWPGDLSRMPVNLRFFDGQYRVTAVAPGNERVLGKRIVKVGGIPIDEVVARLRTLTPAAETKALGDIRIEDFLAIGMLLHGVGIIPDRNQVEYTVADDSGAESTIVLHGTSMDDAMHAASVTVFHQRPLYMQSHDSGLWCEFLDSSSVLYCNFNGYENLAANASAMLSELQRRHPKRLIIDMRFNFGGDYTLGEKYVIQPVQKLAEINQKGHLFVLISAYTFSAGMSNAAQFKTETNAILVGQSVGERPNSYQEAREIRLPNSHLVVRVSTKYYEFLKGSPDNVLRPDKEIPRTWADYAAGRDLPLEWIENY